MTAIRDNSSAAIAADSYTAAIKKQGTLTQQMSSGTVITGPQSEKVDLAISQRMTARYLSLSRKIDGANQLLDRMQSLDATAGWAANMLQSMRELALQSSSDTLTSGDRQILQESYAQQLADLQLATSQQKNEYRQMLGAADKLAFRIDETGEQLKVDSLSSALPLAETSSTPVSPVVDKTVSIAAVRTVTGVAGSGTPGAAEVQTFSVSNSTLANAVNLSLSYGGSTITANLSNGLNNTVADAVAALQTQVNALGASATFDVSGDAASGLKLEWRTTGDQAGLAQLRLEQNNEVPDYTDNLTYNFGGWIYDNVVQDWYGIDPHGLSGYQADLVFGNTTLHAGPFTGSETNVDLNGYQGYEIFQEMATAFNNDPAKAAIGSPFLGYDPVGEGAVLTMRWLNVQPSFPTAFIRFYKELGATETQAGTTANASAGTSEVQDISINIADFQGKSLELKSDNTTLSASLGSSGTLGDLVTALQSDADYASAAFTVSEQAGKLRLSYKVAGPVTSLATLSTLAENTKPDPAPAPQTTLVKSSIDTRGHALDAINLIDDSLEAINRARSGYGAVMNRLSFMVDGMAEQATDVQIARGRIIDTNYAQTSVAYLREQLKARFSTYVMAQANFNANDVLSLLRP